MASKNRADFSNARQKTMASLISLSREVLSSVQDIDTVVESFKKGYLDDV